MQADFDELQLELLALLHRRLGSELLRRALGEHLEVVDRRGLSSFEDEPALRRGLDLGEPLGAGPDQHRGDVGFQGDLEGLRTRLRRCQGPQPPFDVDRGRHLGKDDAVPAARRALLGQDLARPVRDVLPRHLDEAERRDLDDVGLRPVALELVLQRLLDRGAVLRVRHVDEVDDDDPADVAEPELVDDLLDRLEVVRGDRVLEPLTGRLRAGADEAARVDVDDRERLRVVEDEVATGRQIDAPRERGADLLVDAVNLEQRWLLAVAGDALGHVRRGLLQVAGDPLERPVVVDERAPEVAGEEVAHDTERQLGLLVDELRRLELLRACLDRLPELLQEDEVALDVLGGRTLGGRPHDDTAAREIEALEDVLETGALVVVETA